MGYKNRLTPTTENHAACFNHRRLRGLSHNFSACGTKETIERAGAPSGCWGEADFA